jgi:hypothetical protein
MVGANRPNTRCSRAVVRGIIATDAAFAIRFYEIINLPSGRRRANSGMKGIGGIVRAAAKSRSTAAQREFEQFDNRRENREFSACTFFMEL